MGAIAIIKELIPLIKMLFELIMAARKQMKEEPVKEALNALKVAKGSDAKISAIKLLSDLVNKLPNDKA